MSRTPFAAWRKARTAAVEAALDQALPPASVPPTGLHQAMRYGVLGGGKRLRPLLCLAAAEACAAVPSSSPSPLPATLPLACALEFLHSYSLIHDDLPALDDDDLRRGRPTCHRQFGEALAILAGDGLLTLAFAQLADPLLQPRTAQLIAPFAAAAGTPEGMLAGQAEDLAASGAATLGAPTALATVTAIHRRKTGALIRCGLHLGGVVGGGNPAQIEALDAAGDDLGLAFQITDDVLDVTSDAATLGKSPGKDAAQHKLTYPALVGIAASLQQAQILAAAALDRLTAVFPYAEPLLQLSESLVGRAR
ncbi:MAG: polyprenyl synthetase family protein [Terriglobales bacterium]